MQTTNGNKQHNQAKDNPSANNPAPNEPREMKKHKIKASEAEKGARIDLFLSQKIEGLSRNQARKSLQRGSVYVGRKRMKICSYRIKGDENITVYVPQKEALSEDLPQRAERAPAPQKPPASPPARPISLKNNTVEHKKQAPIDQKRQFPRDRKKEDHTDKFQSPRVIPAPPHPEKHLQEKDIIFIDESIVAINKQNGVPSQGTRSSDDFTAARLLEYYLQTHGEKNQRVNLVHRLDQNCSGIMLFSRTKQASDSLTNQFKKHTIVKNYQAIICGKLEQESGEIVSILRDENEKSGQPGHDAPDTEAKLTFEVLERFRDYLWLRVSPLTGKTHQIRRQFADKGLPLLGDLKYGGVPLTIFSDEFHFKNLIIDPHRFLLHSYSIGFQHPKTGISLELVAPIPDDMKEVLNLLRNMR